MLLGRCVFHRTDDICNTFPVCCQAKSESIHIRCTCVSSQSNRHRHGYRTNQSHYNKPNGVVLSKYTRDLIAFSLLVSFRHFKRLKSSTRLFFFLITVLVLSDRYSCDTHCDTAIHLRDRPATIARRCDYSVLSTYNERTNIELATLAHR